MEDMVNDFCSRSAYRLYMKNRKVVMVVAGRGCKSVGGGEKKVQFSAGV